MAMRSVMKMETRMTSKMGGVLIGVTTMSKKASNRLGYRFLCEVSLSRSLLWRA